MSDEKNKSTIGEEDVKIVQQSWSSMKDDLKKMLPKFFIKMFDGMSYEEIEHSSKLAAHASNFKLGITSYVDNLDIEDLSIVVMLIQKTAENHFVRRQIRGHEFRVALGCFLEFLDEVMNVDATTLMSWKKTCNLIADVIDDHMTMLIGTTGDGE